MERCHDLPHVNIGDTRKSEIGKATYKAPMTIAEQLQYKFIVSVEGNDVATNLKWIMSSNSLCLMPEPTYETWFAEARVEPNVHYVPLQPDFSDLVDKVAYFEKHPAEAGRITAAANAYCRKFGNEQDEQAISLLVLYKYFVLSGQIKPDAEVWRYIAG